MALTQSALRLPGPSWDEEVVPALRKRLESESRTLSRRMSAISLSGDDSPPSFSTFTNPTPRQKIVNPPAGQPSNAATSHFQQIYQQPDRADSNSTATPRSNPNPATKPSAASSSYQRSRTYSQPDTSHLPNGAMNGKTPRSTKGSNTSKSSEASRSRPVEPKPTRIPKASRPSIGTYTSTSSSNTPTILQTNGFGNGHYPMVTNSTQVFPDTLDLKATNMTVSSTRSTVGIPTRSTSGIMNESPPFPTSSSLSSVTYDRDEPQESQRRVSNESEEHPFEHWYRGEVSRNGGVGELRVGKRQEMLEIANYGHTIGNKKKKPPSDWTQAANHHHYRTEDRRRHRKRAGSIAGITNKERERGSLYLDDEDANAVGLVLDESPLTDLDGEMSDIGSLSSRHRYENHYFPEARNASSPTDTITETSNTYMSADRSATPTLPVSQSSRNGQYPPTRIPGPSSRRSSESRVVTPTFNSARGANGSSSSSQTPSPPLMPPPQASRQVSGQSSSSSNGNGKRGVSPTSASKKRTPVKSLKGKQTPPSAVKKIVAANGNNRHSVAYYPSPGDGDGGDMADAIPSWTQPVPREGNWDEVVLPVVARKKGLDGHYETADGSPQQSKKMEMIAPAPGTFGYDHTKYRPPRTDEQSIPMDEFGQNKRVVEEDDVERTDNRQPYDESKHDNIRLPVWNPVSSAPFSDYAPVSDKIVIMKPVGGQAEVGRQDAVEDKGAGCCQCLIM